MSTFVEMSLEIILALYLLSIRVLRMQTHVESLAMGKRCNRRVMSKAGASLVVSYKIIQ